MNIKQFSLINEEKVNRALNGTQKTDGTTLGGVGSGAYFEDNVWKREGAELTEDEVDTLEKAILAEYDRLGGLIKKGSDKLKTGSFFDFKSKKPHAIPKLVYTYRVNGRSVDIPDGIELPGEVKAAKILEEESQTTEDDEEKPVKKAKRVKRS